MSAADVALQRAHAYLEDARDQSMDTTLRAEAFEQARAALLDARRGRAAPDQLHPVFEALLQNSIEDRSHVIRSVVPQAVEDLCLRDPPAFVPPATPFLARALQDSNVLVAARAVRALTTLFRKTIGLVVSAGVGDVEPMFPEAMLDAWLKMQQKAVSLIHVQDEGLRKASVKFAETVVLAFSFSGGPGSAEHFTLDYVMKKGSSSPLLQVRALEEEGIRCVKSIAQLVGTSLQGNVVSARPDGSNSGRGLPPASFMTAICVLGNLVRRRRKIIDFTLPPFLSVVPAIIGTAEPPCEAFRSLTEGQRQSIISVMRFNLAALRGYQHARMGRVGVDINQATNDLANFEREQDAKRKEMATAIAAKERAQRAEAAATAEAEKHRAAAEAHPPLKRPRGTDAKTSWPRLPADEAYSFSQSIIQSMPPQEVVNFIMTRLLLNIPAADTVPGAHRANEQNRTGGPRLAEESQPKRPRKSRFGTKDTDLVPGGDQGAAQAKKHVVRKVAPPVVPIRLSALATEKLASACCRRVMTREARAISSGAGPLRIQLLSRLLTKVAQKDNEVASKFSEEACDFIANDVKHNMPLALAWLNSLAWEGEASELSEEPRPPTEHGPSKNAQLENGKEQPNGLPKEEKSETDPKLEPVEEKQTASTEGQMDTDTKHANTEHGALKAANGNSTTGGVEPQSATGECDSEELPPEDFGPMARNRCYEQVLSSILSRLIEKESFDEADFSELITESPLLPLGVIDTLKRFCQDASRIKLALHTLRDIVIKRPGNDRSVCLLMLLEFTLHEDEVLRGPAIRLIANKIFVECVGDVPEAIEKYATSSLKTAIGKLSEVPTTAEVNQVERGSLLLTALCGQKQELLREVALLYTEAPSVAKTVLLARAKDLAAHLGLTAPPIVKLISAELLSPTSTSSERSGDGLEELALQVLRALLKKFGKPTDEIVAAAEKRYEDGRNTDFIIAVLPGLKKEGILRHLPAIVNTSFVSNDSKEEKSKDSEEDALKTTDFKEVIGVIMSSRPVAVTPAELLIELHNIEPTTAASSAIRACFEMKSVYKQEAVAQAIHQLIAKTVVPDLFMRTVHLARIFFPELEKYLSETVMKRLIEKQVWKNALLWEGYLLYCAQVKEKSLKVLLTLPVAQLKDALDRHAILRSLFKELVSNPKNAKKIQVKHRKVIAAAIKRAAAES